jgi:hypothetical protein
VQLFDIQNDPWEMKNLAGDATQAGNVSSLFKELKKLQEMVGDKVVLDGAALGIQA